MEDREFRKLRGLKKERERQKVTQAELARILNVTPQYISALERGLNELTYYDAYIIAKYLGTTPDTLFFNDAKERKMEEIRKWDEMDRQRLQQRKEEFERNYKGR